MTAPRLAAGVVVVRGDGGDGGEGGPRFLLLRAYRNWDFPKGEVEPGEEPLGTARREAREETGLASLDFRWGEDWVETEPYRGHGGRKVARYYLAASDAGEVRLSVDPTLGRPEHHEARWADAAEARALLGARLRPVLEWAVRRLEEDGVRR